MARPVPGSIIELNNSFDEWRQSYNLTRREVFQGTNEAEPNTIVFRDEEGGFKANNLELLTITVGDETHNVRVDPSVATSNGLVRFNTPYGIQIPVGETNQQPDGEDDGVIRYNTSLQRYEGYSIDAGNFISLNGTVSVDQGTFAFASNDDGIGFYVDSIRRPHDADVGGDDITNDHMYWRIDPNGTFLPGFHRTVNIGTPTDEVKEIYTNELHISGQVTQASDGITFGDRLHTVDRDLLLGVVSDSSNNGAAFTGTTARFSSNSNSAYWVATINTGTDFTGLYKENGVGVWTIVNDDGTFGTTVLTGAEALEYYGPQLDVGTSDAGFIVPGFERPHKWLWNSDTEAWTTNETIVIENVTAIKIPAGDEEQRPGGNTDGSNLDAQAGMIRFNTDTSSFEGCINTSSSIWAGLGGVVDSANEGDTFLSVYGANNPNAIEPNDGGEYNQFRFFVGTQFDGTQERLRIDENMFSIRTGATIGAEIFSVDLLTQDTTIRGNNKLRFGGDDAVIFRQSTGNLLIDAGTAIVLETREVILTANTSTAITAPEVSINANTVATITSPEVNINANTVATITSPAINLTGNTSTTITSPTVSINTAGSAGLSFQILRKTADNSNMEWAGFGIFDVNGISLI